jgi:hypothetical protein
VNATSSHRGFFFPGTGMLYPDYYILYSASEPAVAAEFLRGKDAPHYFSSWNPCHFLVNVQPFPGDMDKQLEPAGMARVNAGKEKTWAMARKYPGLVERIELDADDDDVEEAEESKEVESDFYDAWFAGKLDAAIARVDGSRIELDSISFMTKKGESVSASTTGLFVFNRDASDEMLQFIDDLVGIAINDK